NPQPNLLTNGSQVLLDPVKPCNKTSGSPLPVVSHAYLFFPILFSRLLITTYQPLLLFSPINVYAIGRFLFYLSLFLSHEFRFFLLFLLFPYLNVAYFY